MIKIAFLLTGESLYPCFDSIAKETAIAEGGRAISILPNGGVNNFKILISYISSGMVSIPL
jgi:hypothetical protein